MKPRLLLARRVPPAVVDRARASFDAIVAEERDFSPDEVIAQLAEHRADALVISSTLKLDAATIARIPDHVKIAATVSVGYDHIDVPAARARGLIVTNTPDVLTDCTADLAMLLMLGACRRGYEYEAIMRKGWRTKYGLGDMLGLQVSGRTLGILGMGRIGRAVAQRARGFGMKILYCNKTRLPPELEQGATYYSDFRAMLPHSQILSLHAPGGATTNKIMNTETFALLPRGAVFVNASRGALVDESALVAALESGHLFAAGLDVFHNEPEFDTRLAALPNTFLTPHMGSATVETRNAMGFRALDNVDAVCAGKPPIDPLWS
jgi:lactate dehydrogenase-like 2-hydroxyacid dehydrogenase